MNSILNILKNTESPFVLLNYCDILVFIVMVLSTFFIVRKKLIKEKIMVNILLFSYLIIIPLISLGSETNNENNNQEIVDSFNSFYIFLKLPIWWILGVLNILFMYKILFKKTENL